MSKKETILADDQGTKFGGKKSLKETHKKKGKKKVR